MKGFTTKEENIVWQIVSEHEQLLKKNGMNTSANNFDTIEKIIFEDGVAIQAVDIHPELDVMLVILNTKAVLRQKLSTHKRLASADKAALLQYELIGAGTGIHWPLLDERLRGEL